MSTQLRGRVRGGRVAAAVLAAIAVIALTSAGAAADVLDVADEQDLHRLGAASHYAFIDAPVTARVGPYWDKTHVARVGTRTQDGTNELVMILAQVLDSDARSWLKVRLPVRPNGTVGWIPRSAVGEIRRVGSWLRIDTRTRRLRLVRDGKVILRAPIGVGQRRWPTPRGEFYVRSRLSGPRLGASYGPLAFGTSATSDVLTDWPGGGVVGIHGTSRPRLIPGQISHGCIRLRNRDILRLGRRLQIGTPITIT